MQASPSAELIELLGRLKLATVADLRAVRRHARRLAKQLPLFDSVWVDALAQSRRLTAYQAAEINAGRGEQLRVGPYVILSRLADGAYATCFRAQKENSSTEVRLSLLPCHGGQAEAIAGLEAAIQRTSPLRSRHFVPLDACGITDNHLWTAAQTVEGRTMAEWIAHSGRMPPEVVLEIARQMTQSLSVCENAGITHGDIATQTVVLDPLGNVQLLDAGVRHAAFPKNVATHSELSPTAYDYLAPECIAETARPSFAADIYACGAMWWHLLAGRPPRSGASTAARRAAALAAPLRDIYPIAPDTPRVLVEAITHATKQRADERPISFAALSELLGPSTEQGRRLLAHYAADGVSPPERLVRRVRTLRRSAYAPIATAAAAGIVLAGILSLWATSDRRKSNAPAKPPLRVAQTEQKAPSVAPIRSQATIAVEQAPSLRREAGTPMRSVPLAADVRLTSAAEVVARPESARTAAREFVISAARPVTWSEVRPHAGQVICARAGERAQIVLPAEGATLAVENVRFVDVDFIAPQIHSTSPAALVVKANAAAFHRCTFADRGSASRPQTMLYWIPPPARAAGGGDSQPSLALRECTIANVGTAICAATGDAQLSLVEVLVTGDGPMLSIVRSRQQSGTLNAHLQYCTVRGPACAVEIDTGDGATTADRRVEIEAHACVISPDEHGAVIVLRCKHPTAEMLRAITWRGEGSIVSPSTPMLVHDTSEGVRRPLADARLPIEGLVRSELGFAGDADDGPDSSQLVRWQVPLRSSRPPGIADGRLPSPTQLSPE